MLEVLHVSVRRREHLGHVAVVPANDVWGCAVVAKDLEDLRYARTLLERPSLAARITGVLGTPIEMGLRAGRPKPGIAAPDQPP